MIVIILLILCATYIISLPNSKKKKLKTKKVVFSKFIHSLTKFFQKEVATFFLLFLYAACPSLPGKKSSFLYLALPFINLVPYPKNKPTGNISKKTERMNLTKNVFEI